MSNVESTMSNVGSTPSVVAWLGYGGLIPFAGAACAAAAGGPVYAGPGSRALIAYGAVILSFVGALHWAFAMTSPVVGPRDRDRDRMFAWSVVPALLAWTALLLSPATASGLLILGFLAQYWQDRRVTARCRLPGWYLPLRGRLTLVACLCLAAGAVGYTARAAAQPVAAPLVAPPAAPVYREGAASPDGIGKFYAGREIAQVMGFDGAPWLDRPSREREERPDWLVEELRLAPGMTVADVGAGSGYLTRRLAARVAPGKVYAVDVQPPMVALLKQLSTQPGTTNVVAVQGRVDDAELPPDSIDVAVMVDVYHELAFPHEVMQSVVRALKPGGRMVFVEYRAEDPQVPIKALHKMSEQQVRREMQGFPLRWERTSERLPVQHIVVFRKDAAPRSGT